MQWRATLLWFHQVAEEVAAMESRLVLMLPLWDLSWTTCPCEAWSLLLLVVAASRPHLHRHKRSSTHSFLIPSYSMGQSTFALVFCL